MANTLDDVLSQNPNLRLLSKQKLIQYLKAKGVKVAIDEINQHFKADELQQIHGVKKRKKDRLRIEIAAMPYSFQIDVIHMPKYVRENKGINKFLLLVEIQSRRAFAYPLKSGYMKDVMDVYGRFVCSLDVNIRSVSGDAFFSVKRFVSENAKEGIRVYTDVAKNDHINKLGDKLGIIDRLTRTLKLLISKKVLETGNKRWTTYLNEIIDLYNNTPHASLNNKTPRQMFDEYDVMVQNYRNVIVSNRTTFERHVKLKVGDRVRKMEGKGLCEKEKPLFSQDIYTITARIGYRFELQDGDGHLLDRLFRPDELKNVPCATRRIPQRHEAVRNEEVVRRSERLRKEGVYTTLEQAIKAVEKANKNNKPPSAHVRKQRKPKSEWWKSTVKTAEKRTRKKPSEWWKGT